MTSGQNASLALCSRRNKHASLNEPAPHMASRLLRYRIQYTEKQKRWNRKMSGLLLCSPDGQSVFPIAVDGIHPSDGS
jgi:hypothetical protein